MIVMLDYVMLVQSQIDASFQFSVLWENIILDGRGVVFVYSCSGNEKKERRKIIAVGTDFGNFLKFGGKDENLMPEKFLILYSDKCVGWCPLHGVKDRACSR